MEDGRKREEYRDKSKKNATLQRFKENVKYREGEVDLSKYHEKIGPSRQLFIGIIA